MVNPALHFSGKLLDTCARALSARGGLETLASLGFQRRQALRRAAAREGRTVPALLIASVTRRCNLDCSGCYSRSSDPATPFAAPELSDDRFMELFEEAVELGVGVIMVAGGEPLLRPGLLARLAAIRGMVIPVFTNGTLLDASIAPFFGKTLLPVFSIEGARLSPTSAAAAGSTKRPSYELAPSAMPAGSSAYRWTVTSGNVDHALSPDFLARIAEMGASAPFLVEYVPVAPGTEELVLSGEQRALLNDKSSDRQTCPIPSSGCRATRRPTEAASPRAGASSTSRPTAGSRPAPSHPSRTRTPGSSECACNTN